MVVVEGGHPRPSVSPQAAAGCRGRAHLLRRGRPDGAHPGPVHGRPRPLQALRLQRRCHHPVPVRPRRRRLRLPAGLRHPLLRCAPRRGEVWVSSSTPSPSPSHPAVPAEVPRNDTCPELPDIANGWKTASQPELLHGTVVTFHCYPGFELAGTDLLMCHWDLTWSGDLPSCERGERGHAPPVSPPVTPSLSHLHLPVLSARSHHLPGPRGRRAQPQGGLQPQIPGGGHRALRLRQGLRAGGRRAPHLPRPRLGGPQMERPPAQVHP